MLADIETWLAGQYDSEAQLFVESSFGAGEDGNHEWFHIDIRKLDTVDSESAHFLVTMEDRADPSAPRQYAVPAFRVDEDMRAVRLDRYRVTPEDMDGEQVRTSAIKTDNELSAIPCPIYLLAPRSRLRLRRHAGVLV